MLIALWIPADTLLWAEASGDRASLLKDAMSYILDPFCNQDEAISKFKAVIDHDPSDPGNDQILLAIAELLNNGDSYNGVAYPDTAVEVYRAIIEKYPKNRKAVILAHIGIGDIYSTAGRREEARKAYEHVACIDTKEPEWDGIREWVGKQRVALVPIIVGTAIVHGSIAESLVNLSKLKEQYQDKPVILSGIEAAVSRLKKGFVDRVVKDSFDELIVQFPEKLSPEKPLPEKPSAESSSTVVPRSIAVPSDSNESNRVSSVSEQISDGSCDPTAIDNLSPSGRFSLPQKAGFFLSTTGIFTVILGGTWWFLDQSRFRHRSQED
jgi:tetratricopeptide (TPR) repeat protein